VDRPPRHQRCFNLQRPIHRHAGLTLLEQDFESALAGIPSGCGEGVHEELRHGVTRAEVSRRTTRSRQRSRAVSVTLSRIIHVAAEFI
jgi:hypothetical protein